MNRFLVFILCAIVFVFVIDEVASFNTDELKARINKAFQESAVAEQLKQLQRGYRNLINKPRTLLGSKRANRQTIPHFAKNLESFLQKIIPNHNLVQDLMGYITMPNPNYKKNRY